jgi:hypothetical protein
MMSADISADEFQRLFDLKSKGCDCDFCTGRKRHEDNWCSRCAEVRMEPPKHWENVDVCDACDEICTREAAEERARSVAL